MEEKYKIILFYKYVDVGDPNQLQMDQVMLCSNLDLLGRTIVSKEGINSTLEGTEENMIKYVEEMMKDERFSDIDFKLSDSDGDSFPKLSVKIKDEIVSTKLDGEDLNPNEVTGKHLTPEELHEIIHGGGEYYLVDMRNDYEQKIGKFNGAIDSGMKNFRDLKKTAEDLSHLKNKKVITYCTGGVRCEKASGYLKNKGFKDVSQMDGGIIRYLEKYDGEDFDGLLYVFDGRVVMKPFKHHTVIGECDKCGDSTEVYADCTYRLCHKHFICCNSCTEENGDTFCGDGCKEKCIDSVIK
jgi:UPF0176 protein